VFAADFLEVWTSSADRHVHEEQLVTALSVLVCHETLSIFWI